MSNFQPCLYNDDWGQFVDTDLIPLKIPPNKIVLKTPPEEEKKEKEKDKEKDEEKDKEKDEEKDKDKYDDYCNIPNTIIYFRTY